MAERLFTKAMNRANASGSKERSDGRRHAETCGKSTFYDSSYYHLGRQDIRRIQLGSA